ncbi:glycosyltransferase family 9 protein [Mucilaginibacter sp. HD30]
MSAFRKLVSLFKVLYQRASFFIQYKKIELAASYLKNIIRLASIRFWIGAMQRREIIVIALTEHIGDIVACEPVSYYVRINYPKAFVIWVVNKRYQELIIANKNLDDVLTVTGIGEWIYLKKKLGSNVQCFDLHLDRKPCSKYGLTLRNENPDNIDIYNYYFFGNLLQAFTRCAGLKVPDITPRLHIDTASLNVPQPPGRYIVVHAASNEDTRNWDARKWDTLAEKILDSYADIYIVEIGMQKVINSQNKRYQNYCDKLSLVQNAAIIKNAFFFIGIDSGFAHFANSYHINSLILIGHYRDFERYMPYSGYFEQYQNEMILYHNGNLKELDPAVVAERVSMRISPGNKVNNTLNEHY